MGPICASCEPGQHTMTGWTAERRDIPYLVVYVMARTCTSCLYRQEEDDTVAIPA